MVQLGLYASYNSIPSALQVLGLYALTLGAGFKLMLTGRYHYFKGWLRLDRYRDRLFGNLSYPIYINHFALGMAFFTLLYVMDISLESLPVERRFVAFILFNLIIKIMI